MFALTFPVSSLAVNAPRFQIQRYATYEIILSEQLRKGLAVEGEGTEAWPVGGLESEEPARDAVGAAEDAESEEDRLSYRAAITNQSSYDSLRLP